MGLYDNDGFDFEDDERGARSPKELRDAQRAAAKRNKELEEQVAKLTGQLAERNLKDVLADKGLRPGLARVISKEDVDASDVKALEAWLSDTANQEDFGFSLDSGSNDSAGDDTGADGNDGNSEYATEHARMQGVQNGALAPNKVAEAREQIGAAKTEAELQAVLDRAVANATK